MEIGVKDGFKHDQTTFTKRIKLTDASGSNGYFTNSPAGEYGVLFAQTTDGSTARINGETVGTATTHPACGLLFYQAGIAVISGSIFNDVGDGGILTNGTATQQLALASELPDSTTSQVQRFLPQQMELEIRYTIFNSTTQQS